MIEALPHYEKCFFVHYQCNNFNEGESITALNIHSKGKGKEYTGSEAENIKEYAIKINELLSEGLTLVHWNQNSSTFGADRINKRYKDLKGDNLKLEYSNDINLAEWLIFKYGDRYISHPRLDNLAKLNGFNGVKETEDGQRTFASNRLLLITKIYFNAFSNTLKIEAPQQAKAKTDNLKSELSKYGFFELPKVKQLSEANKQSLFELICTNGLPYSIAMFEHLAFIKYLKTEHFTTNNKLFNAVGNWFGVTERTIKGNIYVLNEISAENRERYTADQHKQIVQNDYDKLK